MDISSLSNFSQQTVSQNSLWGATMPKLLNLILDFLTVPWPYFSKPKIKMQGFPICTIGFFPTSDTLTYLCEKSLKSKIIEVHSIVYVKNYLFEEWNYIKRKQIQQKKKKSWIIWHQDCMRQHSHHRHTFSFADHRGWLELVANNAMSLSPAVGWPLFVQKPGTFWPLAVCCHFLRTMALVAHAVSVTELRCLERGQCLSDGKEGKNPPKLKYKQMEGWEISQITVLFCCF